VYLATPLPLRWVYWLLPIIYFLFPMDLFPDRVRGLGWIDDLLLGLFVIWALDKSRFFANFFEEAKGRTSQQQARVEQEEQRFDNRTPHEILHVRPNANEQEIKKAYKKLIGLYHPDKFSYLGPEFEETARRRTQTIIAAYQSLIK
jgi:hypothetical protein